MREMRNVKKQSQTEKEIPYHADPLTYIPQHNTPEMGCFCSEMSTLCVEFPMLVDRKVCLNEERIKSLK